jgi:hypothetical protein
LRASVVRETSVIFFFHVTGFQHISILFSVQVKDERPRRALRG